MHKKTRVARLADNLTDIPLLFPPLRRILFELRHVAFEVASTPGFFVLLWKLWRIL